MTNLDENLELLTLVWLDKFVDSTEENREIQRKLRSKIYYLKSFDNPNDFISFIEKREKDNLILIVSGQYGKEIIEQIHNLNEIVSIFVFCGNKQLNQIWADKYSKIKKVVVTIDELLNEIENQFEDFFNETIHFSNEINEIICLIYKIKSTINDQRLFLNICLNYFQDNFDKIKQIYEFEHFYSIEKCFHWFFNRTFLYEFLKNSLNKLNIKMIYLLRFFFQNLDQQMKQFSINEIFSKGQLLTIDQIEYLTNLNSNQSFYLNNYFIFNSNQEKIVELLTNLTHLNGLHKVLFRIHSNKFIKINANHCILPLFTSFKKISMKFEKRIWFVDLQVDQQEFFSNQIQFPIDLPNYLFNQHLFDQSSQIYFLLLKSYPQLSSQIYHQIGLIRENQGLTENSLEFHLKSIEFCSKDDSLRCHYLNHLAILYDQLKDYQKALHFYFQALKKLKNQQFKMKILNNIGISYAHQQEYQQAKKYFEKCFDIQQKLNLKSDFVHNNFGWICFYSNEYEQAFEQFNFALELTQSNVLNKGIILQNLAFLYQQTNQTNQSIRFYQQALIYFQQFKSIHSQTNIQFIQQQISFLNK